jgi:hypothetical protein
MTEMTDVTGVTDGVIETFCRVMHDAYEAAAVGEGWETQEASRVPWEAVPPANQATMRAAVRGLMASPEFQSYRDSAWWEGAMDVHRRMARVMQDVNAEHREWGIKDYERRRTE